MGKQRGFHGGSVVKKLLGKAETWLQSLGWKYPQEKEMATHSSILAWEIPWTEEPGGLQSLGSQRVRHDLVAEDEHNINIHILFEINKPLLLESKPTLTPAGRWAVKAFPPHLRCSSLG